MNTSISLFTVTPLEGDVLINVCCDEFAILSSKYSTFIENSKWLHTNLVDCQIINDVLVTDIKLCLYSTDLTSLNLNKPIQNRLIEYLNSTPNNFLIFQCGLFINVN